MISCTDFIPFYSELFKFLDEQGGEKAVLDFWNTLSDRYLVNLKDLVREHGIRGCWIYWSRALNEEAAGFTMELDEAAGEFKCTMSECPSKAMLLKLKHMIPYDHYCRHCDVLYRRVLEPLGYEYAIDLSKCDQARCSIVVRKSNVPGR